jgi:hypothetical protein
MAKSLFRGFGISLLSLCLCCAFLSNDPLLTRFKSDSAKSTGFKAQQTSEIQGIVYGSFQQEESREKDLLDDFAFHSRWTQSLIDSDSRFSAFSHFSHFSYVLQDLYLSLPPPA